MATLTEEPRGEARVPALLTLALYPAAQLARAGELDAAADLLTALGAEKASLPSALDLLARIHAQKGLYHQAEALWIRAVDLAPTYGGYRRALERVHRIRANRIAGRLATPWFRVGSGVIAAIAVVSIIGSLLLRTVAREGHPSLVVTQAGVPEAPGQRPLEIGISVLGYQQRREGNEIVFVPDSGLFASGSAALTRGAAALLSTLGRQLESYGDSIEIQVVGYTDDLPTSENARFQDNTSLGMARAVAVYDHLRSTTTLLPAHLSVLSYGESARPFPGTDSSARARNRTVVFRVAKRR